MNEANRGGEATKTVWQTVEKPSKSEIQDGSVQRVPVGVTRLPELEKMSSMIGGRGLRSRGGTSKPSAPPFGE